LPDAERADPSGRTLPGTRQVSHPRRLRAGTRPAPHGPGRPPVRVSRDRGGHARGRYASPHGV